MTKLRPSKSTDQKETEKAFHIIQETIESHSEIEPTLWVGALFSKIVEGCIASKFSYDEFCKMMDSAKRLYKSWFEK